MSDGSSYHGNDSSLPQNYCWAKGIDRYSKEYFTKISGCQRNVTLSKLENGRGCGQSTCTAQAACKCSSSAANTKTGWGGCEYCVVCCSYRRRWNDPRIKLENTHCSTWKKLVKNTLIPKANQQVAAYWYFEPCSVYRSMVWLCTKMFVSSLKCNKCSAAELYSMLTSTRVWRGSRLHQCPASYH